MTLAVFLESCIHSCIHAFEENLRMLPFLFVAFLILESVEHYSDSLLPRIFRHKKGGPVIGAVLGCVPQCGFSALASSLYCGGIITIGTLIAVYISTSDEAILIMMAKPQSSGLILHLLLTKIVIAVIAGYLLDFFWNRKSRPEKCVEDLCSHCGCSSHHGIFRPALNHTLKLFLFLFFFTTLLNLLIELVGLESLSRLMLGDTLFQPFLTALLGLLPNCASSVLITQLLLDGVITFGSAVAGLCSGAGIGLIVLFKTSKNVRENLMIAGILYLIAAAAGIILNFL